MIPFTLYTNIYFLKINQGYITSKTQTLNLPYLEEIVNFPLYLEKYKIKHVIMLMADEL